MIVSISLLIFRFSFIIRSISLADLLTAEYVILNASPISLLVNPVRRLDKYIAAFLASKGFFFAL
jgi:hypothetical protein